MVVLAWLNNSPNTWQTFVANRTAEIQELTAISEWRHVKGKENPADLVSRGLSPCKLVDNELWFKGPSWLHSNVADISPNALNAALRQNYWIISPRSIIRQIIHRCSSCFRCNPKRMTQMKTYLHPTRRTTMFISYASIGRII
jgi:hypothetical protein